MQMIAANSLQRIFLVIGIFECENDRGARNTMDERSQFGDDGAKLKKFREAVQREFGRNLEKATPANVREFMDSYQEGVFQAAPLMRLELNETKTTYEEILKDFFMRVLERPSEEALIMLWLMALEMSFFTIEQHVSDRLQSFFGDFTE